MISHSLTEEGQLIIGGKLSISILLQCVLFYDALRTHVRLIVVLCEEKLLKRSLIEVEDNDNNNELDLTTLDLPTP